MAAKQKIPVLILAGGLGTRLSEETQLKPKPMVEIGDLPILVHIMRWYYKFGFDDFVICAGYRSWEIKKFFLTYEYRMNHLVIDHRESIKAPASSLGQSQSQEKWRVRVIDTGAECMTGGRVARALDEISLTDSFENFALTYGDGVCDVDLAQELTFHRDHDKMGTILATKPGARFGELEIKTGGKVTGFLEKPEAKQTLINGGYFFFKKEFRKYLSDDASCVLERKPLEKVAQDGELMAFKHLGFWRPMDMLRDKIDLQEMWDSGKAPWKV